MATYAVLKDSIVENLIEWDGDLDTWSPDDGYDAVELEEGQEAHIGEPLE